jgi:hypothetical protein
MDARTDAAPAPRKTRGQPSLEVLPPPKIMTADERLKLKKELTAARRQAAAKAKQAVQPAQWGSSTIDCGGASRSRAFFSSRANFSLFAEPVLDQAADRLKAWSPCLRRST